MSRYKVVLKANQNFVMALFSEEQAAKRYLSTTLPNYISKSYLMDKTLKAEDFEVIPVKKDKK